jgi:hypothetical protein
MSAKTGKPNEAIPFDKAIAEGKKLFAQMDENIARNRWRLGEIADRVEKKYGDRTHAKFAEGIGIATCTLGRYRDVFRAWKGNLRPGAHFPSYAVLRELATHKDRGRIIQQNPHLTKREAQDIMRKFRNGDADAADEQEAEGLASNWQKHSAGWFADIVIHAHALLGARAVLDGCTPEQEENLLMTVEEHLVETIQQGSKAGLQIADWLNARLDAASATLVKREDRVRSSPVPVAVHAVN